MRIARFPFALLAAVVLSACGSSDSPTAPAASPKTIEEDTFAASLQVDLATMTKLASGVYVRDVKPGDGATVHANSNIRTFYAGFLSNGRSFDSNIGLAPRDFDLGGSLIAGWKLGIPGMRAGGIRKLVIPWQLAYGPAGTSGIPPYANLVFNVEVTRVNP